MKIDIKDIAHLSQISLVETLSENIASELEKYYTPAQISDTLRNLSIALHSLHKNYR